MATLLGKVRSLHCWLIGHPLPVIFNGPAEVILYGQNLGVTSEEQAEHMIGQVVAFDATKPFNILPMDTDGGFCSQFVNGLTLDSRINVQHGGLLVERVNPESNSGFRWYWRLFKHLCLAALIAAVFSLVSLNWFVKIVNQTRHKSVVGEKKGSF